MNAEEQPFLTPEQVCERLAITPRALRHLTASRQIPVTKVGRANRFHPDEIEAWLRRNTRRAQPSGTYSGS